MEMESDLNELKALGEILDTACDLLDGSTPAIFLARKLLRIRARDGQSMALLPNTVQMEFERERGKKNIVLKARQMGLSTWIAGRFFLKTITQPGTLTLEVAHTQEAAEDLFRMVHRFYAGLPESLRMGVLKTSRANVRSLAFPSMDSEYRVETAGDANAGRGLTVQNLHCSEVSRWPGDAAETLAGLRASLTPTGEVVLESTANGAYGCFYEEWMHAQETGYVRHFFPWWWEPAYVSDRGAIGEMDEAEDLLVRKYGLSEGQVAYRRGLQRQFGRLMRQEYPENAEDCFVASGSCVFDVEAIDRRLSLLPEPAQRRWNRALEVWYPALAGKQYLLAVDPAGGGADGDYCAMQVIEKASGLQCAEFRGRIGLQEIAQKAAELASEYNGALVVIERNNHGHGVLAYLKGVYNTERVYAENGQMGWLTTSLSRPAMLEGLSSVMLEQPESLNSRRLLHECRTFVRDAAGRLGAAPGEHDDCLMAMAMGIRVRELVAISGSGLNAPDRRCQPREYGN